MTEKCSNCDNEFPVIRRIGNYVCQKCGYIENIYGYQIDPQELRDW